MKAKATLLWIALVTLAGGGAVAQFTLYDDGNDVWNAATRILDPAVYNIYYDQGGRGRPGTRLVPYVGPYNGQEYLTIWADIGESYERYRWGSRIAAFVTNDVGLDNSQDWWIQMDITNDRLRPEVGIFGLLLTFKPDATLLNTMSTLGSSRTFMFGICDQVDNDDARSSGIWLEANKTPELGGRVGINPFRLDPDPDVTGMRTGHNYITVEWFKDAQVYKWTVSNVNGSYQVLQPANELALSPTETYLALGSPDNVYFPMCPGWTIWSLSCGQGRLTTAPFTIRLGGNGTATVDGNPAADEAEYFGSLPLHGVASGASDASFIKTAALNGSGWTVRGKCESAYGTTYSHQLMTSGWSGQPEAYSGVPSTLMAQILKAADGTVAFSYVNAAGSVMTWNSATNAWEAGSNVLDIALDGGGNDEWWIAYDGTNYWLSVTNGLAVQTATVPASSVRAGGSSCFFSAGRPWTTGWGAADFTINNLDLLSSFVDPPLSTGPFIVELAGGASANVDGFPVSDGGMYSGVGMLYAIGTNGATDAVIVKTPPLGRHPWTVSLYVVGNFSENYVFGVEVKDLAWSGQPSPFLGWPSNNKLMIRVESSPSGGQVMYWNPAGVAHWYELWSGPWPIEERMLDMPFTEFPYLPTTRVSIGYDGMEYWFCITDGANLRTYQAPGGTPDPVREQNNGSYIAIGDPYTDRNAFEFMISDARVLPYFDATQFPFFNPWNWEPPVYDRISDVKQLRSGHHVKLVDEIVSRPYSGRYYLQEADGSAGIAVNGGDGTLEPGTLRTVIGTLSEQAGERVVGEYSPRCASTGLGTPLAPVEMSGRTLGGGPLGLVKGVELGTGLNNLGLLVKTTGKVTYVAVDNTYFLIDDGSAVADDPNGLGVRVQASAALATPPDVGSYVAVTGGARPYVRSDGKLGRAVMVNESDIQVLQAAP